MDCNTRTQFIYSVYIFNIYYQITFFLKYERLRNRRLFLLFLKGKSRIEILQVFAHNLGQFSSFFYAHPLMTL